MKKINLYSTAGKIIGDISLKASTFAKNPNPALISQAVRVYLSNQRSAHAKSKSRGMVIGTTKKMWSQKGTGNARHGSAKAPQFVGGGKAHGPDGNQNYKLSLSKGMRQSALSTILSDFARKDAILAVEKLSKMSPKTKAANSLLATLKSAEKVLAKSKNIGVVTVGEANSVKRAFSNLPHVEILYTKSLNIYDLAKQNYLVFTKKALSQLNK